MGKRSRADGSNKGGETGPRARKPAPTAPLTCATCGAPVPLVAGDHGTCPSCSASYPIPETYRALRAEADAELQKPRAQELVRALGKQPPAIIRFFAFFESGWFLFLMGFWLAFCVFLGVLVPIEVGRMLGVNTYDVWSEATQLRVSVGFSIGTLWVGYLLSGWAQRRGIVHGGLQAALAAKPPERPGGPTGCRHCGAPLAPAPQALAERCPYCQADNLVHMPAAWVARMHKHAQKIGREIDAAEQAFEDARRRLRRSLIVRLIWTSLLFGVPMLITMVATGKDDSPSMSQVDPSDRLHIQLPDWSKALASRIDCPDPLPTFIGVTTEQRHCNEQRCDGYTILPLRKGETIVHTTSNLPEGTSLYFEIHEQGMLDDDWVRVAKGKITPEQPLTTTAPRSGWYRVRLAIPGGKPRTWSYCPAVR